MTVYGPAHRALRVRWAAVVASGAAICARCGLHIAPHEKWQLDHDDWDKTKYLGPSHAFCNSAAGGRNKGATRGDPEPKTRSDW